LARFRSPLVSDETAKDACSETTRGEL
jgi:hypothetical protein